MLCPDFRKSMTFSTEQLADHLDDLQSYLQREQPLLAELVDEYRQLDQVAYAMGLLPNNQSFADQVSWWPLIAVLGTFSSGKSTFINDYLEFDLQRTGHQAVDDKFSVICYAAEGGSKTLPGSALDADPRFPFFSISKEIEVVAQGEGRRLDSYLQLKTCPSEKLKGKIFVDSPGFDADDQRTATLSITDRIIERSDLVLVFFDAHRPEPGAIRDTLEHLVENVIHRHDSSKFIYILNQIDVTADENNLEDVVAAWQRALAQKGLTAGRFYRVFSQTACTQIKNEEAARRLLEWREQDMGDLTNRLEEVEMERIYRVADALRRLGKDIEEQVVPDIRSRLADWRRFVLWGDASIIAAAVLGFLLWLLFNGAWDGLSYTQPEVLSTITSSRLLGGLIVFLCIGILGATHYGLRRMGRYRLRPLRKDWRSQEITFEELDRAYDHSTRGIRSIFWRTPAGWHWLVRRRLTGVMRRAGAYIQRLNDRFISTQASDADGQDSQDYDRQEGPEEQHSA